MNTFLIFIILCGPLGPSVGMDTYTDWCGYSQPSYGTDC